MVDWKTVNWGSVADWVAGIGSLSAAIVALYVAQNAQRIKLRGYCGHRLVLGAGMPTVEVFSISVTNTSQRSTVINNVSVSCGLSKWKRQGIITVMASSISHGIPKPLADGETGQWSIELGEDHEWLADLVEKFEMTWLSVQTLLFGIHTSNGGTLKLRPDKETRKIMLKLVEARKHGY